MAGQDQNDRLEAALVQRYHTPDHSGSGQAGRIARRFTQTRLPLLARLQRLTLNRTTIAGAWVAMPYRLYTLAPSARSLTTSSALTPTYGTGGSRLPALGASFGLMPTPGSLLRATTQPAPGTARLMAPATSQPAAAIQRQAGSPPAVSGPPSVGVRQQIQRASAGEQPDDQQEETVNRSNVLMRAFTPVITAAATHAGNRPMQVTAPLTTALHNNATTAASGAPSMVMPTVTIARRVIAAPDAMPPVMPSVGAPFSSVTPTRPSVSKADHAIAAPIGSLQHQPAHSPARPIAPKAVTAPPATTHAKRAPLSPAVQRVATTTALQPSTQPTAHAALVLRHTISGVAPTAAATGTTAGNRSTSAVPSVQRATAPMTMPGRQTPLSMNRQPAAPGLRMNMQTMALPPRHLTLPAAAQRAIALGQTVTHQPTSSPHQRNVPAMLDGGRVAPLAVAAAPSKPIIAAPVAPSPHQPPIPPSSGGTATSVQRITAAGSMQPTVAQRAVTSGQPVTHQPTSSPHQRNVPAMLGGGAAGEAVGGVSPLVVAAAPSRLIITGAAPSPSQPAITPIRGITTTAVQRITVDGSTPLSPPLRPDRLPVVAPAPWRPLAGAMAVGATSLSQPTAFPSLPMPPAQAMNSWGVSGNSQAPNTNNGMTAFPAVQRSGKGGYGANSTTNTVWLTAGARGAVQRADLITADRAAAPTGTSAPAPGFAPTATMTPDAQWNNSSHQTPDLERLADEVYAILERRITIERESLGL